MPRIISKYSIFPCRILFPAFIISISMLWNNYISAQEVIVHQKFAYKEDGNPKYDADWSENGIVIWKPGAVHVVNETYQTFPRKGDPPITFIVKPGAIIKLAAKFIVDEEGKVVSCIPGGGSISSQVDEDYTKVLSVFNFDGVTITDIRDDEVGGDTDQDGGKYLPNPDTSYSLFLSTSNRDIITNCTIKYCEDFTISGSGKITDNRFFKLGDFYIGYYMLNTEPLLKGNTFEGGKFYCQGTTPVFENNKFIGAHLEFGGRWISLHNPLYVWKVDEGGPMFGKAVVFNNIFENTTITSRFMDIKDSIDKIPPLYVSISNNRFQNSKLEVNISDKSEIFNNEFNNSELNLIKDFRYEKFNSDAVSLIKMNHNSFDRSSASFSGLDSISYRYWSNGLFVDAQYNYWGDPSGPEDKSSKDGFYNPYGRGMKTGNGIDYRYFIGGSNEAVPDYIKIEAKANPLELLPYSGELIPNVNFGFNVKVTDYKLSSSYSGKIALMIRDESGMILNGGGAVINVTNSTSSLEVPQIQVKIPDAGSKITVEASLSPDAENALTVYSNQVIFTVKQPESSFQVTSLTDPSTGQLPDFVSGSNVKLRFEFTYSLAGSGNGRLEIDLKEKECSKGVALTDFPLETVDVKPGTMLKASKEFTISLPDRKRKQSSILTFLITMKNDKGEKVGAAKTGGYDIRRMNCSVSEEAFEAGTSKNGQLILAHRTYFQVGEVPVFALRCSYMIEEPDVTNWKIKVGPLELLDKNVKLIYTYNIPTAVWGNLSTTGKKPGKTDFSGFTMEPGAPEIASEGKYMRLYIALINPSSGDTLDIIHPFLEVRTVPITVEKDVSPGQSQVSFDQIPLKLDFKSNNSPGKVTALEFQEQYTDPLANGKLAKTFSSAGLYQKFIPLNRYWSVYDSLPEGSYEASLIITYDPEKDFPFTPDFNEDSLVIASINPNNHQMEALPSVLDKASHTIATSYLKFFDTYIVASKTSSLTEVKRKDLPHHYALNQNYPNPFNPATIISYTLAEKSRVILKVYDVLGREVSTLVNHEQSPGEYLISFNGSLLPSGVYIYTIHAGKFNESRKLLLIK